MQTNFSGSIKKIKVSDDLYSVADHRVPDPPARAGLVLSTTASSELEWSEVGGGGAELPPWTSSNEGDVLRIVSNRAAWSDAAIPEHTVSDEDKVLTIKNNSAVWDEPQKEIPAYSSAQNGKLLGIENGQLAWVTLLNAEEMQF